MNKRAILLGVLVLVVAATAAWFEPSFTARGLILGEPFFQNRSSSWWHKKLLSEEPVDRAEIPKQLREGKSAAFAVLSNLLHSPEPEVRWQSAAILGELGPDAASTAPALASLLDDADPHVRTVAAKALGDIHPDDQSVVDSLVAKLATGDRRLVIRPLSNFKNAAKAAPALIPILEKDPDATLRWEAARTLGKIHADATNSVPALMRATKDRDALVREHAAEAIGDFGPEGAEGVPALIAALGDPEARVRRDAVRSLGQIGAAAKPALGEVEKLINDPDANVRDAAKKARRLINPGSPK
jgi:HEAT repeat protein